MDANLGRRATALSDTYAGISPSDVLPFIASQAVGMPIALGIGKAL